MRLRQSALGWLALGVLISACSERAKGTTSSDAVDAGRRTNTTADDDDVEPDAGSLACRTDGPRYNAFLKSGTCTDVVTPTGTWSAGLLFHDAPPSIRNTACTYRWSTTKEPDVAALSALDPLLLTQNRDPKVPCEPAPSAAPAVPITPDAPDTGMPTGVSGCDVCAQIGQDRRAFVILPVERLDLRNLYVRRLDGRVAAFEIAPPSKGAQVFSVALPDDTTYATGSASIYEAP